MPELPEVETTRRGIESHVEGKRITKMVVRERRLRWPIPESLEARLAGQRVADWLYLMKSGNRVFLYDYSTQSFITDF